MESLNLFTLFSCTLGLVSASILCEFFESFVFDIIRLPAWLHLAVHGRVPLRGLAPH